jgi:hypothetical protein
LDFACKENKRGFIPDFDLFVVSIVNLAEGIKVLLYLFVKHCPCLVVRKLGLLADMNS